MPKLAIDSITVTLLIIALTPWLAQIITSIQLPGGWKIDFQELQQVTEKADQAGLLTEPKKETKPRTFQIVADKNPRLSLAGFRYDIDKYCRQMASMNSINQEKMNINELLRVLVKKGLITTKEQSVLADLINILDTALKGAKIDHKILDWAQEIGPKIIHTLELKSKLKATN